MPYGAKLRRLTPAQVKARATAFARELIADKKLQTKVAKPRTPTMRFSPHGWTPRPVTPAVIGRASPRVSVVPATPPRGFVQATPWVRSRSLTPSPGRTPPRVSPLSAQTPEDITYGQLAMRRAQQGGRYVSRLAGQFPRAAQALTGAGLIGGAYMAGVPVNPLGLAQAAYDYFPSWYDVPVQAGVQIGHALVRELAAPVAAAAQHIPAAVAPALHFATRALAHAAGYGPADIAYMVSHRMIG